jgi:hypothetical protein
LWAAVEPFVVAAVVVVVAVAVVVVAAVEEEAFAEPQRVLEGHMEDIADGEDKAEPERHMEADLVPFDLVDS